MYRLVIKNERWFIEINNKAEVVLPDGTTYAMNPVVLRRLSRFLKPAFNRKGFDCFSFVSYLATGLQLRWKVEPRPGEYKIPGYRIVERNPQTLSPGSFICLRRLDGFEIHWFLYLGDGYTLSKLGFNGISVESLETIRQGYPDGTVMDVCELSKKKQLFVFVGHES